MATAKKNNEQVESTTTIKNVELVIKEIQVYSDGNGVVDTLQSKDNPSESGVFKQSAKQLARLATRCGAPNVIALKLLVQLGGSKLTMETELKKAGDSWENEATGETGVFDKDFIQTNNESIQLGARAVDSLLAIAMRQSMEVSNDLPM